MFLIIPALSPSALNYNRVISRSLYHTHTVLNGICIWLPYYNSLKISCQKDGQLHTFLNTLCILVLHYFIFKSKKLDFTVFMFFSSYIPAHMCVHTHTYTHTQEAFCSVLATLSNEKFYGNIVFVFSVLLLVQILSIWFYVSMLT